MTDIVDSTKTAAEIGDAAWRQRLSNHNRLIRRPLERFGGREVDTTRDGFLATFTSGEAGLRAALAAQDAVGAPASRSVPASIRARSTSSQAATFEGIPCTRRPASWPPIQGARSTVRPSREPWPRAACAFSPSRRTRSKAFLNPSSCSSSPGDRQAQRARTGLLTFGPGVVSEGPGNDVLAPSRFCRHRPCSPSPSSSPGRPRQAGPRGDRGDRESADRDRAVTG
jgi:hypothetical protein